MIPTSFDTETHLIRAGRRVPRLVCASWKIPDRPAEMATRDGAIQKFRQLVEDDDALIVAANAGFDLSVMVAADPTLLEPVFRKVEMGLVSDISVVRQPLLDIADGCWGKDRTALPAPLRGRYSVEYLAKLYLGLDLSQEKKDPRSPRLRYCEMEGLPLSAYPKEFVDYSLGDADHELAIWLAQEEYARTTGNPNLYREAEEFRAAWSLNLMSIWGFRTDPDYVERLAAEIESEHVSSRTKLLREGLLKVVTCKRKKLDDGTIREEVPDEILPEHMDAVAALGEQAWVKPFRNARALGKHLRFSADQKALMVRVTEAYMGNPPRSERTSKPKTDRDTLYESGDPVLELYGETSNIEKLRGTYVPILRQGTRMPVNPEYNAIVESDRTSCAKPNVQNFPR